MSGKPHKKRFFVVELKTWPGGPIPLLMQAESEDDAHDQAQQYMRRKCWKGRVGEIKVVAGEKENVL